MAVFELLVRLAVTIGILALPASTAAHAETSGSDVSNWHLDVGREIADRCASTETCAREVFLDVIFGDRNSDSSQFRETFKRLSGPIEMKFVGRDSDEQAIAAHAIENMSALMKAAGRSEEGKRSTLWIFDHEQAVTEAAKLEDDGSSLSVTLAAAAVGALDQRPDDRCIIASAFHPVEQLAGAAAIVYRATNSEAELINLAVCLQRQMLHLHGLQDVFGGRGFVGLISAGVVEMRQDLPDHTELDLLMLRLAFDQVIRPGMTKDEVKAVFTDAYLRQRPKSLPIALDITFDGIDQQTMECIAAIECTRERFLQMAVRGSAIEPRPDELKVLSKQVLPAVLMLDVADGVPEQHRLAAERGWRHVKQVLRFGNLPVVFLDDAAPATLATHVTALAADPTKAKTRDFRAWLDTSWEEETYDDMARRMEPLWASCAGLGRSPPDGLGMRQTLSVIKAEPDVQPAIVRHCVIEETIQAFGLFNDIRMEGANTLFDDLQDNAHVTGFDLFMLALLYHPLIEAEMREEDVLKVFDQVYRDVYDRFADDLDTLAAGQ